MKYFLFLNHPKGEKVYKEDRNREQMLREHFSKVDVLNLEVTSNFRII